MKGIVFLLIGWISVLAPSGSRAAQALQTLSDARLVEAEWADGDSFPVTFADPVTGERRLEVFRLYGVDCMETLADHESDRRRILEQARHFGVENPSALIAEGRAATDHVRHTLAEPFTVFTSFAQAPGRSGKPRYYAFIRTARGEDLGLSLAAAGMARVKGITRETGEGLSREEYAAQLADAELAAALQRAGIWRLSNPARLAALRADTRREERELAAIRAPSLPKGIDLNTASEREIKTLPGVGPVLAGRILLGRPYRTPEDLLRVKGIGQATFKKLKPFLQVSQTPSESGLTPAAGGRVG